MYAGITDIVDIPAKTESGYAAILKTGYVYWVTDSKWDKARKKTTDKRVPIGKIAPEPGKMYPNNRYAELFGAKEAKEAEAYETKDIGKGCNARELSEKVSDKRSGESSGTLPDELSQAGDFDSSLSYGPYAAMLAAFSKIGALDALIHAFPKTWRAIFAAALHAVLAETSSARDFAHWAFDNYAGIGRIMTDRDMDALLAETGARKDCVSSFFDRFHKNFHASSRLAKCLVAFDNGKHAIRDAYWVPDDNEKPEQDSPMPGIHTAMYVDQATGIPIWYEHFDGNIFEKAETPYTAKKAASLGYQKLLLRTGCQSFSCTGVRDSLCYSSFQCPAI